MDDAFLVQGARVVDLGAIFSLTFLFSQGGATSEKLRTGTRVGSPYRRRRWRSMRFTWRDQPKGCYFVASCHLGQKGLRQGLRSGRTLAAGSCKHMPPPPAPAAAWALDASRPFSRIALPSRSSSSGCGINKIKQSNCSSFLLCSSKRVPRASA